MGRAGVNIAGMSLARHEAGGNALTVLNLDTAPNAELLAELRSEDDIISAMIVQL